MEMKNMDPKLYKAAKEGDVGFLRRKLENISRSPKGDHGDSRRRYLLSRSHRDNNAIHIAARYGDTSFVEEALQHVSTLSDQQNSKGDIPLHIAARFGHLELVELLLRPYGFRLPYEGTATNTILGSRTSSTRQREMEEGLLHQDVPTQPPCQVLNSEGSIALHEALRNGHEDVSLYLLRHDRVTACFVNQAGESPLYLAVESNCEEFMRCILDSGSPYSTQGPQGQNALHVANHCTGRGIKYLLTKRPGLAKEKDDHGKAAIHYAVEAEFWQMMRLTLEADPSVGYLPDADGLTPLLIASSRGCWKICQKILDVCPESIEARNTKGQNVLHLCFVSNCCQGENFLKIPDIRELINECDDEGNTPLHLAIEEHRYEKARLLGSCDSIDLSVKNKEGLTALDMCESDWKLSCQKRTMWFHLRKYGAPHGRRPNQHKIPVMGPDMYFIPPETDMKAIVNTLSVVAALLATVTFAAAFTMPGGYNSSGDNLGVAVLVEKAALRGFILSDTIAMSCSFTVLFLLIWAMFAENDLVIPMVNICGVLLYWALHAALVAFVTGVYATIASDALWLAILVCVIASVIPFVVNRPAAVSFATGIWLWPHLLQLLWKLDIKGLRHRQKRSHWEHDYLSD